MDKPISFALPWCLYEGEGREFVYITDADGEQIARINYAQREAAAHIVVCVNAFEGYEPGLLAQMVENGFSVQGLDKEVGRLERAPKEKTFTDDCLLNGICAHHGDSSAGFVQSNDSEGGLCD